MLFTDGFFLLYFLPATLILLRLLNWRSSLSVFYRIGVVAVTLVFYAYENWLWDLLFLFVALGIYAHVTLMSRCQTARWRRAFLIASVVHGVLCLAVFKYLNWLSGLIPSLQPVQRALLGCFGTDKGITLPPGISFYVFEALSFSVDVYRRQIEIPRNPLNFVCFIAMFPRFIAGPIVRYKDVKEQFEKWPGMALAQGLSLFALGFAIKILLADQFAVFVPYAYGVARPDLVQAWLGVLAYTFQLYLDFWSYSIMATGLGLCLGFRFPDNFRSPYAATSITHFWQCWHITLSRWIRDYIYIPLGGNRISKARTLLNLCATMTLAGLWHGAGFTFLVWGLYHGACLAVERAAGEERLSRAPAALRKALTFLLVVIGWVTFRSDSFRQAVSVYAGMIGLHGLSPQFNPLLLQKHGFSLWMAGVGLVFMLWGERLLVRDTPLAEQQFPAIVKGMLWLLLLPALAVAFSSAAIPFLYFQF